MPNARAFFFVCAGILLLVLTYHFGASSAGAQSPAAPEIAVLSGSLGDNEYLPLPTYRDGTAALPSECRWIVSPGHINMTRYTNPVLGCEVRDDVGGILLDTLTPDDDMDRSRANYMIVAVRGSAAPTPAQGISIGQLKAKYAAPAPIK